jgi:hypothetical protein
LGYLSFAWNLNLQVRFYDCESLWLVLICNYIFFLFLDIKLNFKK